MKFNCNLTPTQCSQIPCQISKMKYSGKTVNAFQSLNIFAKLSILDVLQGSQCDSVINLQNLSTISAMYPCTTSFFTASHAKLTSLLETGSGIKIWKGDFEKKTELNQIKKRSSSCFVLRNSIYHSENIYFTQSVNLVCQLKSIFHLFHSIPNNLTI